MTRTRPPRIRAAQRTLRPYPAPNDQDRTAPYPAVLAEPPHCRLPSCLAGRALPVVAATLGPPTARPSVALVAAFQRLAHGY